jgi:hypothetical protein
MTRLGDELTYPMADESPGVARRELDRFVGRIERSLLDDMRIITSELITLAIGRSPKAKGSSILVTTSLASNVLRIEVDHIVTRSATPTQAERLTPEAVIRGLSDRCAEMLLVPFRGWAEIDVHTNGVVSRVPAPA